MLKYNIGDRLIVKGNITSNHGFDTGEVVSIVSKCLDGTKNEHYLAKSLSTGTAWYINELEMKEEGVNTMSTKHDGYVVVELTECTLDFGLTKEQALTIVDRLLYEGVDAENILVFPPNSNLDFVHTVKFID